MTRLLLIVAAIGVARASPADDAAPFVMCGASATQAGDFVAARTCYEQAYQRDPDPRLRYNLARLSEKLGDREAAIGHYTAYLATEAPEKGPEAQAALAALTEARDREAREAAPSRTLEWLLIGSGAAAAVGGGVLHGLAFAAQDDADALVAGEAAGDLADLRAAEDRAHGLQTGAIAAYCVGGALVAAGITVWLLDDGPSAVSVGPGGLSFAF